MDALDQLRKALPEHAQRGVVTRVGWVLVAIGLYAVAEEIRGVREEMAEFRHLYGNSR